MYLNVDADFLDHPKTTRLVARLGKGSEVLLIRLWAYCGRYHSEDGKLTGYDEREIEALAKWWGKPGEMLEAMRAVGYMAKTGEDWLMEGWQKHQGHISALKKRGRKMAEVRWGRMAGRGEDDAGSIADSNAASIATALPVVCLSLIHI